MPYDVITDPQKELSVLVEPELGRALGPVASGPNGEAILEAFVGALGVDPATLEHWEITHRYTQYLEALLGDAPETEHEHTPPAEDPPSAGPGSSDSTDAGPASADPSSGSQAPAPESVVPTDPAPVSSEPSGTTSTPDPTAEAASAEAEASAAGGDPPAPAPADADPTTSGGTSTSPESAPSPGGDPDAGGPELVRATVPEDKETCPQCDGWGTIARNGQVVDCPLCQKEGYVSHDAAEAYANGIAAG